MKRHEGTSLVQSDKTDIPTREPGTVTILHVDDDPNDTALFQAANRKADVDFELWNAQDGEEAIAYLSGTEKFGNRKRFRLPSLVLLDLKMPRANGFEILRWIRSHPLVSRIPVVVLSGSELQEDVRTAYAAGADSYLVKPLGFEALVKLIKNLRDVWISAEPQK